MYDKTERLLAMSDGLLQDSEYPEVWWVRSLHSDKRYRVQVYEGGEFLTCSCPHGLNNLGHATCYHARGVEQRLMLSDSSG